MEDLARVTVVILSSQGFSLLFSGSHIYIHASLMHKHSFMHRYACLCVYVEKKHIQIKKAGVTLG